MLKKLKLVGRLIRYVCKEKYAKLTYLNDNISEYGILKFDVLLEAFKELHEEEDIINTYFEMFNK